MGGRGKRIFFWGGGGGGGGWGPQWKDGERKVLSLAFELVVSNKPPAMCC